MTPLTKEQIAAERLAASVGKSTSSYAFTVERVCDSHEVLRAALAAMTAERDDWKLSFESSNEHVGQLEAKCASLQAQIVATAWLRHADPVKP